MFTAFVQAETFFFRALAAYTEIFGQNTDCPVYNLELMFIQFIFNGSFNKVIQAFALCLRC